MTAATYQPKPMPYQPGQAYAGVIADQSSPFERLGFNVLLVFLFLAFSRITPLQSRNLFPQHKGTLRVTRLQIED